MAKTTSNKYRKWWKQKYKPLIGQEYPDHHCHCPDHCPIIIASNHCYTGIPKFLQGHYIKVPGHSPALDPAVAVKISKSHKGQSHSHSAISKEIMKYRKGVVAPGPTFWKTFNDICREGTRIYNLKFHVVKRSINRILKTKNLTQLDAVVFINWICGHNFMEIAEHYYVTPEEVIDIIRKVEKIYPGITMSDRSFPVGFQQLSYELLYRWEEDITYNW